MNMGLKLSTDQGQGQVNEGHSSFKLRVAHATWPI